MSQLQNGVSTSWRLAGEDVDGPINRPEEKESVNVLNYLLTCDQDLNVVTKDERKQVSIALCTRYFQLPQLLAHRKLRFSEKAEIF